MVLPLIAGGVLAALLGYFTVSAAATLAHWLAVAGAMVFGGVFFRSAVESSLLDSLGFSSQVFEFLTAGVAASVAGFVFFKVVQALITALGFLSGLLVVLFGLSVFLLGFPTVIGFLETVISEVFE